MTENCEYVAFLRGINVGGHHKVVMADLRDSLAQLGFKNVRTILNSGNILFEYIKSDSSDLESRLSEFLGSVYGFSIPALVLERITIEDYLNDNPFNEINGTKDTRLYVTFLKSMDNQLLEIPWSSEDNSFQILERRGNTLFSVLDLSISKTPKAMEILEKTFGKEMTTRNWKTILRIREKWT